LCEGKTFSAGQRAIKGAVRLRVALLLLAHHPLHLLCHLNRLIILCLAHTARVEKLLYLRPGVALEHLPKLLEPLENVVPGGNLAHLLKQWITH
jgi:hypothetical protein